MSAQIDTSIDSLIGANQGKSKAKSNTETGAADVFASLIQGQIPSNIVFSRVDTKLTLPQKSASPDFKDPLDHESKHTAGSANANDHSTEASDNHKDDNDDEITNKDDHRAKDAHAEKSSAPALSTSEDFIAPDAVAQTPISTPATQTAKTDAATLPTPSQAAPGAAAKQDAPINLPAQASETAKIATASKGPITIENMDAVETADIEVSPLTRQTGKAQNNIQATVTSKPEEMASKPNATLAANAAVAAQTSKEAQGTGNSDIGAEGEKTLSETEGNVNNAFTKGQNQNNNTNGQQNSGQKTGAEIAQANANANALQNANFNSALNSAASSAPAPLNSAQQQTASQPTVVDPMAGVSGSSAQNSNVQNRAATSPTPQAKSSVPPRVISEQVAVNIQRAVGAGNDRISIQLRPTDLGRIDITMEMSKDGRMTAVISADKSETLEMLKSDAKGLIQSLNDAGLQTDTDGLSFNLNSDEGDASQFASNGNDKGEKSENEFDLDGENDPVENAPYLADGEKAEFDDDGHIDVNV